MALDTRLLELRAQLRGDDPDVQRSALEALVELLDLAAESRRTGVPAVLADDQARALVRSSVVESIDRDPRRPVAATAIWALGKLYDPSLERYLADLATLFLDDDGLTWHLRQTVVALDNLGALDALRLERFPNELPEMRAAVAAYLDARQR